ncbi:hypothetical protein WJ42_22340 [Burkholderia cepacia]|nr:hypothetical protein WJ42_22340 [Burkholderia cepacia]KWC71718.1 hypothetical protein WL55_09720 [Burkholderia cepacia]
MGAGTGRWLEARLPEAGRRGGRSMVMQDRGRRKAGGAFCAMRCRSWCVDAMLRGPSMAAVPIAIPAATPGRRVSAHMEITVESRI